MVTSEGETKFQICGRQHTFVGLNVSGQNILSPGDHRHFFPTVENHFLPVNTRSRMGELLWATSEGETNFQICGRNYTFVGPNVSGYSILSPGDTLAEICPPSPPVGIHLINMRSHQ